MIQDPVYIALILLMVVVITNQWASSQAHDSKLMRILPTPVWCYIPPTLLTTAGILPYQSPVYDWISTYILPACLILLLMTTDLLGLKKVGRHALVAMALGTFSVFIGAVVAFLIFREPLGPENWKAIGTLSASWIGGTANEIAVKQATGLSDSLFTPLWIADITVVYIWMTVLMMLSGNQKTIDRFLRAGHIQVHKLIGEPEKKTDQPPKLTTETLFRLLVIAFGFGLICIYAGNWIPEMGLAVNHYTWIVILVTAVGLTLSFTPVARDQSENAQKVGFFLFYFVLAATGAKANLLAIVKAPLLIVVGLVWAFVVAVLLVALGRWLRIPMALLATASQANLGGVVSAPIVASTYEPKLIPVALILAILGNALGNYAGLSIAYFLRYIGT